MIKTLYENKQFFFKYKNQYKNKIEINGKINKIYF